MGLIIRGGRIASRIPRTSLWASQYRSASRATYTVPIAQPPAEDKHWHIPTLDECPSPTCQCRETPPGLDIDRESKLNGTMPAYAEQVIISTGRTDWKSRIQEDEDSALVNQLAKLTGPKGKFFDPTHGAVSVINSSIPPTPFEDAEPSTQAVHKANTVPAAKPGSDPDIVPQGVPETGSASAFLFPSFQYVPSIPTDDSGVEAFVKGFVLPATLQTGNEKLTRAQKNTMLHAPEARKEFPGARSVHEIVVLICGHGGRDARCGTMGPILQAEFEDKLERQNIPIVRDAPPHDTVQPDYSIEEYQPAARVGQISHIGGHKWAGNVIVYIPPSFKTNPLAGCGIWYGRVEPHHVEGIVGKTLLDGKVIKTLFRGGIREGGEILRLDLD
ncbi:hypothetical protein E4T49_01177 [Aureobasidium sp. EXF-10728]|nr:hypothetical protein E4T49_01177 [Aureobasidium sp. EXF-10728]